MAIAVRCVVRAPPKTSLVVRRAGAAQNESGGGRLSVQSFSTSMGIYVGRYVFSEDAGSTCDALSRGASKGSTAHESLSCKQVYGHHFLGAPHASSFCFFLASAVDGGTDGVSFRPSSSSASPCPSLFSADVID